jgi:hypothetical protein
MQILATQHRQFHPAHDLGLNCSQPKYRGAVTQISDEHHCMLLLRQRSGVDDGIDASTKTVLPCLHLGTVGSSTWTMSCLASLQHLVPLKKLVAVDLGVHAGLSLKGGSSRPALPCSHIQRRLLKSRLPIIMVLYRLLCNVALHMTGQHCY